MRKIFLFFFFYFSFFITNYSLSQSGWYQLNTGSTRNFSDVYFVNENTGWCVGDSAVVIKTTNGGLNWAITTAYNNQKLVLNFVRFADSFTGYAAGTIYDVNSYYHYRKLFLKTTNQGQDWLLLESVPSDYNTYYSSISLFNRDTLFLSTFNQYDSGPSYGEMRKSLNGGINFVNVSNLTFGGLTSLSFINYNTGWASAYCANDVYPYYWDFIYKTTNSGTNWILQYKDSVSASLIDKIQFIDQNTGFGISEYNTSSGNAKFFKTTNGGLNWSVTFTPNSITYGSLYFINASTGWICGYWSNVDSTTIARTTDGGQTFQKQRKTAISEYISSVYFVNSLTGYAVGGTKIYKTTNGGVTAISKIQEEIPCSYKLFQNYPNPFNPATNIRYQIQKSSFVNLRVYDLLGREVATLANEKLNAGEYEAAFDGSNLPSGVYFYKLTTGDFTEIKKMLLIK